MGNESIKSESLRILIGKWKDGTFGEILDDWKWIFSYSVRFKGAIALFTLLGILSSTLGLASSVAGKFLVDVVVGHKTDKLWLAALVMTASALSGLLLSSFSKRLSAKVGVNITNVVRQDVYDHVMNAGWESLNDYTNGDILNRINTDIGTVSSNAISWLPTVVISVYTFLATFAVIWHYSPVMSLIALSSAPVVLLMSRYLIRKQREYRKKVMECSSTLYTFETESLYNVDTIKSFGATDIFAMRLDGLQQHYKNIVLAWNMFQIRTDIFMTVLTLVIEYIAFGYALFLLWGSRITYGTMVLFLQQRSNLSGAFNKVVGILPSFISSSVSAHRIRELMEMPQEPHRENAIPEIFRKGELTIRMEDVTFAYESGEPVILRSDFVAAPGQITALVGPSGEGKTTMLRLLLGIVSPQEGQSVFLAPDGQSLDVCSDSRCLISYVPQGNSLLSGTIAENMRLGKADATDEEIIAALELACAWDFISKLPDGINSSVRERGKGLSEGQAQRVAIARALLRDAPIVLMDEATSALDVDTERKLLRNIMQKRPERTIVITTHRPTVLGMCDRIYRVVDSRVVALGAAEIERLIQDF